jgi:hypothetical protein
MRKRVFAVLAVLIIAALNFQMAIAAPHGARKAVRAPAPVNHQIRDAFGSVPNAGATKTNLPGARPSRVPELNNWAR